MSPKTEGAVLEGVRTPAPDNGIIESYGIALRMPFTGGASETVAVRLFVGPLDHKLLKSYENGLENIMSLGWAWVIDRKSTRLNSSHSSISYAVFCFKKKKKQ